VTGMCSAFRGGVRNSLAVVAVLVLVLAVPLLATADITPTTRWADPTRVRLDVEFPGEGYHASWELYRCDCGDLLVHSELNAPGDIEKGETLLVEGRAVLSRGFGDRQAELGASLDAPALMMQLALRLLERAEPSGPGTVTAVTEVDIEDQISHIHLETQTATGGFQAPWTLDGEIAPLGPEQRRFDLHFHFMAGAGSAAQSASMRLRGQADFADSDFPLAGSTPLADWQLTWRDENDAAAGPAGQAETLAELRELLRGE
jgi:hypothetical protein